MKSSRQGHNTSCHSFQRMLTFKLCKHGSHCKTCGQTTYGHSRSIYDALKSIQKLQKAVHCASHPVVSFP